MRTAQEILDRIDAVKGNDWMGTQRNDLIACLSFEDAKPFLKEGVKPEEWQRTEPTRENTIKAMLDYMPFAWEKACDGRGLSAGRSMDHYTSWVWLAGDDLGDLTDYQFYGKDNLVRICKHYGFDHTQWDDGVRSNTSD